MPYPYLTNSRGYTMTHGEMARALNVPERLPADFSLVGQHLNGVLVYIFTQADARRK